MMICPKCKNRIDNFVFDEVNQMMMCPICGYLFSENVKDKEKRKKESEKNLKQGTKFGISLM